MAITLADFNKIWASTSPLTPYSFSEANYKQGWNFIGSTPPARQMWDFLQKNNDEKMQYLANNYLPLSGGTMSGKISFGSYEAISRNTNDSFIRIFSGTGYDGGASITMFGANQSGQQGQWYIRAKNSSGSIDLTGKPDGTLDWGGHNVLTDDTVGKTAYEGENVYTAIPANTHVILKSISLSAGTWVVVGRAELEGAIVGRQLVSLDTGNTVYASYEGTVGYYSDTAMSGGLPLISTRIFILNSTTTINLLAYATAATGVNQRSIRAVRIV